MLPSDPYAGEREAMVRRQIAGRGIIDPRVLDALRTVPRHAFVPPEKACRAYEDHPLEIGSGQTISQPYMVAKMTELLELTPQSRVLEIGTGSGYQAAVLSHLAASVLTVERVEPLARRASGLLAELGRANVEVRADDGTRLPAGVGPFDAIVVTACAPRFPETIYRLLRDGGRLVVPLEGEDGSQTLYRFTRREGRPHIERSVGCRFVPLLRGLAAGGAEGADT